MAHRQLRAQCALLTAAVLFSTAAPASAQFFGNQRSVGGVAIDANGVVAAPTIEDRRTLDKLHREIDVPVLKDLDKLVDLRAVSLRQLEAVVARRRAENRPIPDEVSFCAGLLRVEYVLVYPDRGDIVLAGPAEGWKADQHGNVVGATTNQPVVVLDDLMVAMRAAAAPQLEPISCSIDPTPEGIQRLRAVTRRMRTIGNPDDTMMRIEEALGPQVISVTGVPADSHFARTMVAADFRMKRIAMNFEPAPIDGLPSFLHMLKGGKGLTNLMPRWWLAPNYEPLATGADGLAWQIRGPGVQCMTEEDYFDASGKRRQTGKANATASRWAERMTAQFKELAAHDSSFGKLRNAMDLAVVATLIERQGLLDRARLELPVLRGEASLASYPIPRSTASKASFVKTGREWVISASGGVQLLPWEVADLSETSDSLHEIRDSIEFSDNQFWAE
ncbi:DUF1598 domain-containing protein [Pirellulales bacterium]|nr:DUF1598 domain-containing protein [Pirellulales bacterium]